jgi:hypothetical protein
MNNGPVINLFGKGVLRMELQKFGPDNSFNPEMESPLGRGLAIASLRRKCNLLFRLLPPFRFI